MNFRKTLRLAITLICAAIISLYYPSTAHAASCTVDAGTGNGIISGSIIIDLSEGESFDSFLAGKPETLWAYLDLTPDNTVSPPPEQMAIGNCSNNTCQLSFFWDLSNENISSTQRYAITIDTAKFPGINCSNVTVRLTIREDNNSENQTDENDDDDDNNTNGGPNISGNGISSETLNALDPLRIGNTGAAGNDDPDPESLTTPAALINRFFTYAFPISGMILFIMLVWGGFETLSGAATQQSIDNGKQRITAAIFGFVLLFSSYWIVQIIEAIFDIGIVSVGP